MSDPSGRGVLHVVSEQRLPEQIKFLENYFSKNIFGRNIFKNMSLMRKVFERKA